MTSSQIETVSTGRLGLIRSDGHLVLEQCSNSVLIGGRCKIMHDVGEARALRLGAAHGHVIKFETNLSGTRDDGAFERCHHLNPKYLQKLSSTSRTTLMAGVQSVKIVARLRPPIPGELSDNGIRIITTDDDLPAICVNNPRDRSQIFKFP